MKSELGKKNSTVQADLSLHCRRLFCLSVPYSKGKMMNIRTVSNIYVSWFYMSVYIYFMYHDETEINK